MFGRSPLLITAKPSLGGTTTWNPAVVNANAILQNGNRDLTASTTSGHSRSTTSKGSDKWYAEVKQLSIAQAPGVLQGVGLGNSGYSINNFPGDDNSSYGYRSDGGIYINNAATINSTQAPAWGGGDVIMIAADYVNTKLYFGKNGVWANGADPVAGTGGLGFATGPHFIIGAASQGRTLRINTGQDPFEFTIPSGFSHWG